MGDSSEEEAKADAKTSRKPSSVAFANPFAYRAKSSTTVNSRRDSIPTDSEVVEDGYADRRKVRSLIRSRSEDVSLRVREQWGNELWKQGALKESVKLLRSSIAEYEKEASQQQWKDLLKINADVADLGKLADGARKTKSKMGEDDESVGGLSKFSTVALEYSKMLDVVMNQAPEYAGLAWGAIRMLLVAHTNHSKLKHAVEHYIIQFGQDFGVINQLMNSHPTEKMVEAVCEAYAAFSKFLAKAVKYYKESKMMSAIKAFGFPWETRFQGLVTKIEAAFKRIKDIASAGHFGMTVQTHRMVETLGCSQENMRHEMRRNTIELREQLKLEMRDEVQSLFQTFDRNWISRFEQIMIQSIHGHAALEGSEERKMISTGPKTAAIEDAESMTETASNTGKSSMRPPGQSEEIPSLGPTSASFLADHVSKPKRLKRFRDKSFVHLQEFDNDYAKTNVRLRHTTTQDLQQIMSLLRNDGMRAWLQASASGLIWVNTVKRAGPCDWATAFAARIVEYATKLDNMTVLYHLCGNHPTSSHVSTPAMMLQSLIMQLLEQHHKHYVRKAFPFTLEYFQNVQDDIHDLWNLFLKCCTEASVPCVWLILDHVDNLKKGEDYDFVLQALLHVVQDEDRVFKVCFSARTTGTPDEISEKAATDPSINSVTVPKAASSTAAAMLSKQKRTARLPDEPSSEQPAVMASKAEIDTLLHSSSEDDQLSDKDNDDDSNHRHHHDIAESTQNNRPLDLQTDNTDIDLSDSSMEFTRDEPFASTDDDESDAPLSRPANNAVKFNIDDDYNEDEDEDFSFTKRSSTRKPSSAAYLVSDSDVSEEFSDGAPSVLMAGSKSKLQSQSQPTMNSKGQRRHRSVMRSAADTKSPSDSSDSEYLR